MLNMIDTIVLDLGGVLIDVDYTSTARAFADLGAVDFEQVYSKARQSDIFDRFETGALGPDDFRVEIRKLMACDLLDEQIDHCWNAMLGEIPPERIELIKQLRDRFTLLLLSNT